MDSDNRTREFVIDCTNNSKDSYYFYIYKRITGNESVYSLVWLCSTFRIMPGKTTRFYWKDNFSFFYDQMSNVKTGQTAKVINEIPCNRNGQNTTEFYLDNDKGIFSEPFRGNDSRYFSIDVNPNVSKDHYVAGLANNGNPMLLQKASPGRSMYFYVSEQYYIAAAEWIVPGQILDKIFDFGTVIHFSNGQTDVHALLNYRLEWYFYPR